MSGNSSVSCANGFIDLATYSELESFLYGGPLAISFFVAGVQKANWFTIVPIQLRNNGTFGLAQEGISSSLNRSGDYVLNVWFRCLVPTLAPRVVAANTATARWTRNLMHNMIKKCSISFNELTVEEFDNYWLDFNTMFRLPAEKQIAYKNMIGDISELTTPWDGTGSPALVAAGTRKGLYGGYFSVVLPFWFGEDSGIALPAAALPFNDIKINYTFRSATELIVYRGGANIADTVAMKPGIDPSTGLPYSTTLTTGSVDFTNAYTYAHYAVIHNDERTKMGDAPRDMLIRQVQNVSVSDVPSDSTQLTFDVRLSHAIVSFFFAFRNKSQTSEWSNYTTNFDYLVGPSPAGAPSPQGGVGNFTYWDPIARTQLLYENTLRLDSDSDFYSMIHPYLFSDAAPDETGYHMWTYALKPWDPLAPSGSTNYSKLANVSIVHHVSNMAQYYLTHNLTGLDVPLRLSNVFVATNWNIARVANGSLGHPTL